MQRLVGLLFVLLLAASCQSPPPPAAPAAFVPNVRTESFDHDRAWAHLAALTEIGPRVVGTPGNVQARAYLLEQLKALNLTIVEQEATVQREGEQDPIKAFNVAARIDGTVSEDVLILAAPYDTTPYEGFRFVGANDGASGAAVLLEIARVLAADPLPYRVWVVFLDAEAPAAPGGERTHAGSQAVIHRINQRGLLPSIRMGAVVNQVCDPDLKIQRDLTSNRIYREEIWRAAGRLGETDAFPRDGEISNIDGSHQSIFYAGMRRVVAISDDRFGGDESPGLYAGTEDDDLEHCSADSLETVGRVLLEGLVSISQRLAKIDRFSKSPIEGSATLEHLTQDPPAEEDESAESDEGESAESDESKATPNSGDEPAPDSGQDAS